MPSTNFGIYTASLGWRYPDSDAFPHVSMPPVVRFPQPQGFDGNGQPCRYIGEPFAEVGRPSIRQAGFDWWMDTFTASGASVSVSVKLLDPRSGIWKTYTAEMLRPTYEPAARRSPYIAFLNFRVRFVNLVEGS